MIEGGQIGDAGVSLIFDRREQSGLREGQRKASRLIRPAGRSAPTTASRSGPRAAVLSGRFTCTRLHRDTMYCNGWSRGGNRHRRAPEHSCGDWQNRVMPFPGSPTSWRRAGSLQPNELAQAAVMAALCAAIAIIAVVVPFAAGLSLLGTVPMGLPAYRYRLRVVLASATIAAALIAFLIGGFGGLMTVINCAYIGGLTGIVKRRGRGLPVVVAGVGGGRCGVRRRSPCWRWLHRVAAA